MREGLGERRAGEMNNSLTGGMKKPQRVCEQCGRSVHGAVWRSTAFGSYITLIQQEDIA